jgi:integrase
MISLQHILKEDQMASVPTPPRPSMHHGYQVWRSRWYDDQGVQRDKRFGRLDRVSRRQAVAKYNQWMGEWHRHERVRNPKASAFTYLCSELAVDFTTAAKSTFKKNDRITSTCWAIAYAMDALATALGSMPASSVDGPHIASLRDAMIKGNGGEVRGVSTVNDRLYWIKRAFKWARERGLVTKENLFDIWQVSPLKSGRCEATAPVKVLPVDEHWVAVTTPHLASGPRAMVELQWLSGMRPGDVCVMRPCDIDMSGEIWFYRPHTHKMEHRGTVRIVPLGPRCQKIIESFLGGRATDAYLFSPAEARDEKYAARRQRRRTPLYPSHQRRYEEHRSSRPRRTPGDVYSVSSYRRAIHRAIAAANRWARGGVVCGNDEILVPHWSPHQLRHSAATRLNKQFGLEDVSVMLGHSDLATTRIYALPDVSRAVEIARKVG